MTARELVAIIEAVAERLSPEQRKLVGKFVGVVTAESAETTAQVRRRHERERKWEEEQLHADPVALSRRSREPA